MWRKVSSFHLPLAELAGAEGLRMRQGQTGRKESTRSGVRGAGDEAPGPRPLQAARPGLLVDLLPLAALVLSVLLVRSLGLSLIPAVLVATTFVVASAFGLVGAILALAVGAAIYQVLIGLPSGVEAQQRLAALAAGTGFVGLACDGLRRWKAAPAAAGGAASARAAMLAWIETKAAAMAGVALSETFSVAGLAMRVLLALVALSLATGLAILARAFGEAFGALTIVLGTLLTASAFGRLGGVLVGLVGGLALALVVAPVANPAPAAVAVATVLGAMGGWLAGLREAARARGQVVERLGAGMRALNLARDEAGVRRELLEALAGLGAGGRAVVLEDGAVVARYPLSSVWTPGEAGWQAREMRADDRVIGDVRWRHASTAVPTIDAAAHALIDLAASALVRLQFAGEVGEREEAARIEHLRTVLLDAVSHHFRSPLSGILGSVTSILNLQPDHDPAVSRKLLFIIKDQTNRLSRYVDNFISVARLESGDVDVRLADVSVEALVYDVWESLGDRGGARRFLVADIDPAPLRTDPALLGQALGNVLENAIKYSPEASTVEVTATRQDGRLVVSVANEGVDPPPGNLDRIFERFYRSRQVSAPGLGLGLYITRSLARVLGGDVRAVLRANGAPGLIVELSLPEGAA